MPPYSEVFRTRGYLALFVAAALSTWGDYLARVVVAAYVLDQTGSPFAAAATFAVSLLPSIFGRSLLAPISDRVPYKYVLIVAHVSRAVLVGVLIVAVRMAALDQALMAEPSAPVDGVRPSVPDRARGRASRLLRSDPDDRPLQRSPALRARWDWAP